MCGKRVDIEVEVVRDFAALAPLKSSWNALAQCAQTATVFQTYEWHACWWRAFGATAEPLVLIARAGGEIVAIAPLMRSRRRVLGRTRRVVEFIGTRMSDYCDFIVEAPNVAVIPIVLGKLDQAGFDVLHLRDIPEASPLRGALHGFFGPRGRHLDRRALYEAPAWRFGDAEADQRLTRKKSLRRHYNHFARSGKLEFKARLTRDELPRYLDVLFEQHIGRWARTDTPSLFEDERMRAFFRDTASALSEAGWLLFSVVEHDGVPIALHMGFEFADRIIWYKPSFDVGLARFSPGEVLIKCLLEYALARGVSRFDFTIGEDPFKYRFANEFPKNYAVRVFRSGVECAATRLMLGAKARVEAVPALARLGRRLAGRWRDYLWM